MAASFDINIALKGKDAGAGSLLDSIAMKAKMLRKEETAGGETALERLLKQGPEGIARMFGAGLAVTAIDLGARALDKMGTSMQEVRRQFVEGKADAGDMFDQIAEGIPVMGEVWKAGRDIREALTGEKLAVQLLNEEAKLTTKYFDDTLSASKELHAVLKSIKDETGKIAEEEDEDQEADPLTRKAKRLENAEREQEAADTKKAEDDKAKVREQYGKKVQDQKALEENLKKQFRNKWGLDPNDIDDMEEIERITKSPNQDKVNREMAQDLTDITNYQHIIQNKLREGTQAVQSIDDAADQLRNQRRHKLDQDLEKADFDSYQETLKATEEQMVKRRELEQSAADQVLEDRKKAAEDQAKADEAASKEQEREDKDAAKEAGRTSAGERQRREPFHADLMNSRYHGLANARKDPVAENTGAIKTLIQRLVALEEKRQSTYGFGAADGIVLRA